jgi:hypothetical protein
MKQVLPGGRGVVGTGARGEEVGKEYRRVNMVQLLCTHVCKWKMIPIENSSGMGEC